MKMSSAPLKDQEKLSKQPRPPLRLLTMYRGGCRYMNKAESLCPRLRYRADKVFFGRNGLLTEGRAVMSAEV